MNDFNLPGEPSFAVLDLGVPRTPLRPMAPAELEVREYLAMSCLPVRSPSPVGWAADEFPPAVKVERPLITYPPSFAHTILAGEGLAVDFDFDELLLPEPQPRFASPSDVSPCPDGEASSSTMGSPEGSDALDISNCNNGGADEHCEVLTIGEIGEDDDTESIHAGDDSSNAKFGGRIPAEGQQEETGTGETQQHEAQQEGDGPEEGGQERYEEEEEDDEEEEEMATDASTGQKRKRSQREVGHESDDALRQLIGEETSLVVNGRYRCRWTIVFGGGCEGLFKTPQTHDRHVCAHVPDTDGKAFKAYKCRLKMLDEEACTTGTGCFSRRDPCMRHIGKHLASELEVLDGKSTLFVRRRPWWWPSPLFLTSTFNLKDERLTARPAGESRSWREFLQETLNRHPRAVNLHGGADAPAESDADFEPSRRRSKRVRRS